MIIGLVQYKFINGDTAFNLSQIQRALRANRGKADLLCFGESFLPGMTRLVSSRWPPQTFLKNSQECFTGSRSPEHMVG